MQEMAMHDETNHIWQVRNVQAGIARASGQVWRGFSEDKVTDQNIGHMSSTG